MRVSQEKTQAIKEQLSNEAGTWQHKHRYGLFSYLPHHGFGFRDNNEEINRRDANGNVMTGPKNFQGGRPQSAHNRLDAFTKTGYLSINNEYVDPTTIMKYRSDSTRNAVSNKAFKPSGNGVKKIQAPYEYISDPVEPTRTAPRPKNFLSGPGKKGSGNTTVGHLFSNTMYAVDPHEYPGMKDSLERRDHQDKILHGPFQTTFKHRDHFTTNNRLYRDPPGLRPHTTKSTPSFKPFLRSNPPKTGYNRTINKFPEYSEEGEVQKVISPQGQDGQWKYTYREKSVPTKSIQQYNTLNRPRRKF